MPYGKYKGLIIAELPDHYLNWFVRESFPNNELGQLLVLIEKYSSPRAECDPSCTHVNSDLHNNLSFPSK